MGLQSCVQDGLNVVVATRLENCLAKDSNLLFFLISSMIKLTPFVKLAVECGAVGSNM